MKSIPLKIGTKLALVLNEGDEGEAYHCKVVDFKENYLMIDYPVHVQTKKTKFIPNNAAITINFVGEDQAVYEFETKITARIKLNVPALAIRMPKREEMKRIQRREFVRVDATVDIAIHPQNDTRTSFTSVTADISGGGLSFILPKEIGLQIDDFVDLWMVLHFQSGKYHYIHTESQVVFNKEKNGVRTSSVKFLKLKPKEQQLIISFCFEKQREMRKKELS